MIKFFRGIRKKLLAQSKFTKYLLYAIGEIVLVVIGILIALQINNNNEARKAREKEVGYLQNLKVDLINGVKNSEEFADYHFQKARAGALLLNQELPKNKEEIATYTDNYELVFIWYNFEPNNNTFKELLSSGNLSLIKNDGIKNGLLELDKMFAEIASGEHHMRREYEEYLYDIHIKNTTALGFYDTSTPKFGVLDRLSPKEVSDEFAAELIADAAWQQSNKTFLNGLKLAVMNNSYLASMHKDLVAYTSELIEQIDVEIEK